MRSCPAGLFSRLQSDDLLVEHYIFLFYDHVLMVVAEKPVFELAPLVKGWPGVLSVGRSIRQFPFLLLLKNNLEKRCRKW